MIDLQKECDDRNLCGDIWYGSRFRKICLKVKGHSGNHYGPSSIFAEELSFDEIFNRSFDDAVEWPSEPPICNHCKQRHWGSTMLPEKCIGALAEKIQELEGRLNENKN